MMQMSPDQIVGISRFMKEVAVETVSLVDSRSQ